MARLPAPNYSVKQVKKIVEGTDVLVRLFTLAADDVIPWHYHSKSTDYYFVLSGSLAIATRDPETRDVVVAGEHSQIAPNTMHCIENAGSQDCHFLLIQGVGTYDFIKAEAAGQQAQVDADGAVIAADRDGVIREWNPVAERIFGHSAEEAIGQTLNLVVPPEERADHWRNYRRVMATGILNYSPDHVLDVEGLRKDGARVWLDVMLKPMHNSSNRLTGIVAVLREFNR